MRNCVKKKKKRMGKMVGQKHTLIRLKWTKKLQLSSPVLVPADAKIDRLASVPLEGRDEP